jgi:hypothetical protein
MPGLVSTWNVLEPAGTITVPGRSPRGMPENEKYTGVSVVAGVSKAPLNVSVLPEAM